MDKAKRVGPDPPPFRRKSAQHAAATPPPAPARPTKHPKMTLENAKKELTSRKLVRANSSFSLNTLIEILLAFTGKEVTEDGLGEPWEIVMATAVILEAEMVRQVSRATADATVDRVLRIREGEEKAVKQAVQTERESMETREEMLKVSEERLTEEKTALEKEKLRVEVEKKKTGEALEATLGKMKEVLKDFETERKALQDARKETVTAAPNGPLRNVPGGPPPVADWNPRGGWGYEEDHVEGGHGPALGSYASAVKTSSGGPGGGHVAGDALSERTRADNTERMKRGEEKRERQFMLDAEAAAGQSALKGLTEKELLEKARKSLDSINGVEVLEGKPEKVEIVTASRQNNGGVLYELNSKEARDWLGRPDVCDKFTDGFDCAVKYRPRKFPVLVERVPVEVDINKKETLEAMEEDNGFEKGGILNAKWVRHPSRREYGQRHAHLIFNCKTKEIANAWIAKTHQLGGKHCTTVKLLPEPLRCYNCQLPGHQANQCISEQACGTCGGAHRTDRCANRTNTYCLTCKEKGHPTWSTSCPNYVTRCANLSDRVPDNRYRYYVTSDEWTWELISNAALDRRFRVPNANRAPPPPPPASGTNATPLGEPLAHPRPDNLAQPTQGGTVIPPRQTQTQLTDWVNKPGQPSQAGAPQPSRAEGSQSPLVPQTVVNV